MLNKLIWLFFVFFLSAVAACNNAQSAELEKKYNFIVILVDDLGWKDLGCYGSTFHHTPNIDSFSKSAVRFTNAYSASPVCSPTRASLLTGRAPARDNITDWIGVHRKEIKPLSTPKIENHLNVEIKTVANILDNAQYNTSFIGKWHLGKDPFSPLKYGFRQNIAGSHRGWPKSYFSPYKNDQLPDGPPGEYLTDRLTSESINYLKNNKESNFFLYLSYFSVHTPIRAPKKLIRKYQNKLTRLGLKKTSAYKDPDYGCLSRKSQNHPVYAAMVERLDWNIGRLLDSVRDLGLSKNTVICITSDNGAFSIFGPNSKKPGPASNYPLRGGKGWLFEGGIRIPLLFHVPNQTNDGATCRVPVTSQDLLPTLLEIGKIKKSTHQLIDGKSMVPLLQGNTEVLHKDLFWHYPHYSNQGSRPSCAIRRGPYKLIRYFEDESLQLFNIEEDIRETNNLISKFPSKAHEMNKALSEWLQKTGAKIPVANSAFKSSH